jgi:hypothetical protein
MSIGVLTHEDAIFLLGEPLIQVAIDFQQIACHAFFSAATG